MEKINTHFGDCKFKLICFGSVYDGEWYYLKINDLPDKEQIKHVIYDIENNEKLEINNSKIVSTSFIKNKKVEIDKKFDLIINNMEPIEYEVLIFDSKKNVPIYEGQPLVFICNPQINFIEFPQHNHLNPVDLVEKKFGASICYTNEPNNVGKKIGGRINEAIFETYLWLFRHKVWFEFLQKNHEKVWIGPQKESIQPPELWLNMISPDNLCRCGSLLKYGDCCFITDLKKSKYYNPQISLNVQKQHFIHFVNTEMNKLEKKLSWFYEYLRN